MTKPKDTSKPGSNEPPIPVEMQPAAPGPKITFADVTLDPDYAILVEAYQHGEFTKCQHILNDLLKRYHDNHRLLEFQKDLEMQLSLKNISQTYSLKEKQKKKTRTLRMSALTVGAIIFVILVFIGSFWLLSRTIIQQKHEADLAQLTSMEAQVVELLHSGQPQVAAEIIEKMRQIDEGYENLDRLTEQTNSLLMLEAKYNNALSLIDAREYSGALVLLKEIDAAQPGLWDVTRQIENAEIMIQVLAFLQAGNDAYQAGKWSEVITAYESALELDPELDDPLMKEQLLNGYLRKIIEMLENDSTAVEDIENAEQYYRKALSMIPQSKAFASERENLQKVSSSLLQLKFTQTAKSLLNEREQTFSSISKAVSYLSKAVNLDPKNSQLQQDLRNAELYQVAFRYYTDMNWGLVIEKLKQLLASDSDYANGNARVLLYEAYYALGRQYYAVGVYEDARSNLEEAEILAYENGFNKLKLFQVQMLLGDTIARMGDSANAISYYQYALNSINANSRASGDADLSAQLIEAEELAASGFTREAAASYYQIHQIISRIYTIKEVEAVDGTCLAFFADQNASTSEAIINANGLPQSTVITFGRKIKVPTLD